MKKLMTEIANGALLGLSALVLCLGAANVALGAGSCGNGSFTSSGSNPGGGGYTGGGGSSSGGGGHLQGCPSGVPCNVHSCGTITCYYDTSSTSCQC